MASVNATVRDLIAAYPCGYKNRTQALHQILVVNGSGYEWRGGQAINRDDPGTCEALHERSRYSAELVAELQADGVEIANRFITGECPAEARRLCAAELSLTPGLLGRMPYQASPGLLFLNVPDDAADDWKLASAEIARWVGPLWARRAAEGDTIEAFSLTPEQREYVNGQRTEALQRFQQMYGYGPAA
ncbi:hypothetical protein [Streptomyces goshikiensis]|uniref:hypothetical protein n=1 Tax=Streptomyces goshikiensis TaxID=1942 RepID=UPI0036C62D3C